MVKLDIGCGKNKREGFVGVDQYQMEGVDVVHDLSVTPWPFEDDSVSEVNCSHFLEHLSSANRVKFFNELYRIMETGAKATIITPHWSSNRAYGDFTHQWPPVAEMLYFYLSKEWRATQAPHTDVQWNQEGYNCDFEATWGYAMRPDVSARSQDYQAYAMSNYKEACQDLYATITKK